MSAHQVKFDAIGTRWDIQVADNLSDSQWAQLCGSVKGRIAGFDTTYSRFRDDSLVTRISREAGSYELPPDAYRLLNFYEQLYRATDGKVTPLIGQTMVEAGYNATYSLQAGTLHTPPEWKDVMTYDERRLVTKQPVLLDFGAAGKGYLVDIVAAVLVEAGCKSFVIDAGGDILHRSAADTSLAVGLENPRDASEAIGIVHFTNKSLCASSGSKRTWKGMHHIINPVTLQSPSDVIATWVLAADTMTADGLATALFFVGADKLKKQFSFSCAVLGKDMNVQYNKTFPVELFKEG